MVPEERRGRQKSRRNALFAFSGIENGDRRRGGSVLGGVESRIRQVNQNRQGTHHNAGCQHANRRISSKAVSTNKEPITLHVLTESTNQLN